jgi:DNA-binding PadR family transcriptional regulator
MSLQGVLLALLSSEPDSGYGLSRRLRKELAHVWEARLQQIYVELSRLENEGLVEVRRVRQRSRPAKKVYRLTESGEESLEAWLASNAPSVPHRDERLARLLFLRGMPAHVLTEHLETWLEGARADVATLEHRLSLLSRTDPTVLGTLLTLDVALARARCEVGWCGRVLAAVGRAAQAAEQPETLTTTLTA